MKRFFEKIPRMTKCNELIATITVAFALLPMTSGGSELERLRSLVAEQERQIRLLEEQNARLRNENPAPRGSSPSIATAGTDLVSSGTTATRAPQISPTSAAEGEYTVAAGDSLARIGRRFGVSVQALERANGLKDGSIIHPGQKLRIPGRATATPAATAPAAATATTATHTVQAGETFYSIALQHGVSVNRLIAANPDVSPNAMRVGQKIRLVDARPAPAAAATPPAETADDTEPASQPSPPESTAGSSADGAPPRQSIRTIMIDREMSFREIAAKFGTTPERINQLNGLDLDSRTILAKGSELYVPAQP